MRASCLCDAQKLTVDELDQSIVGSFHIFTATQSGHLDPSEWPITERGRNLRKAPQLPRVQGKRPKWDGCLLLTRGRFDCITRSNIVREPRAPVPGSRAGRVRFAQREFALGLFPACT